MTTKEEHALHALTALVLDSRGRLALRLLRWLPPLRWLVAALLVRRGRRALVGIALEAARLPDVSRPIDRRLRRSKTARRLRRRARRMVSATIRRL